MPATWASYGVDANRDGSADPDNPVDAIFAAARYLQAAGAQTDLRSAIFAYNHAGWYVTSVLERAQRLAALPADLVAALTGLASGRSPVLGQARALKPSAADRRSLRLSVRDGARVVAVADARVVAHRPQRAARPLRQAARHLRQHVHLRPALAAGAALPGAATGAARRARHSTGDRRARRCAERARDGRRAARRKRRAGSPGAASGARRAGNLAAALSARTAGNLGAARAARRAGKLGAGRGARAAHNLGAARGARCAGKLGAGRGARAAGNLGAARAPRSWHPSRPRHARRNRGADRHGGRAPVHRRGGSLRAGAVDGQPRARRPLGRSAARPCRTARGTAGDARLGRAGAAPRHRPARRRPGRARSRRSRARTTGGCSATSPPRA